jgi:hypothetical protein
MAENTTTTENARTFFDSLDLVIAAIAGIIHRRTQEYFGPAVEVDPREELRLKLAGVVGKFGCNAPYLRELFDTMTEIGVFPAGAVDKLPALGAAKDDVPSIKGRVPGGILLVIVLDEDEDDKITASNFDGYIHVKTPMMTSSAGDDGDVVLTTAYGVCPDTYVTADHLLGRKPKYRAATLAECEQYVRGHFRHMLSI